jgi:hypothetical protein
MPVREIEDFVIRNCRIGYRCEQDWDDLVDRGNKNSRYCSDCKQDVVRCATVKQLKAALAMNACVAIPIEGVGGQSHLVGDLFIKADYEAE